MTNSKRKGGRTTPRTRPPAEPRYYPPNVPHTSPAALLSVVDEPPDDKATKFVMGADADPATFVFFTGVGGLNSKSSACGRCGRVLIVDMGTTQSVRNVFLCCPTCDSWNYAS